MKTVFAYFLSIHLLTKTWTPQSSKSVYTVVLYHCMVVEYVPFCSQPFVIISFYILHPQEKYRTLLLKSANLNLGQLLIHALIEKYADLTTMTWNCAVSMQRWAVGLQITPRHLKVWTNLAILIATWLAKQVGTSSQEGSDCAGPPWANAAGTLAQTRHFSCQLAWSLTSFCWLSTC